MTLDRVLRDLSSLNFDVVCGARTREEADEIQEGLLRSFAAARIPKRHGDGDIGSKQHRPRAEVERKLDGQADVHALTATGFLGCLVLEGPSGDAYSQVQLAAQRVPGLKEELDLLCATAFRIGEWRETFLGFRRPLSTPSEVESWLAEFDEESAPSLRVEELEDYDIWIQMPPHLVGPSTPFRGSPGGLGPDMVHIWSTHCTTHPALRSLAALGRDLAAFGWEPHTCNGFIVAGTLLKKRPFSARLIAGALPGTNRMLMEVSTEVDPSDLAKLYELARLDAGISSPRNRRKVWEVEASDLLWRALGKRGPRATVQAKSGPRDGRGRPVSKNQVSRLRRSVAKTGLVRRWTEPYDMPKRHRNEQAYLLALFFAHRAAQSPRDPGTTVDQLRVEWIEHTFEKCKSIGSLTSLISRATAWWCRSYPHRRDWAQEALKNWKALIQRLEASDHLR